MVVGTLGGVGTFDFLNVAMVFEFTIFVRIEFHSFAPDSETVFCPIAVLR